MLFTPLHRYLGEPAGPLTEAMVDQAIRRGVPESDDLDWKAKLPPERELQRSDIVKDIAAMANSGGGMLVFGVEETERVPTGRVDAGEVDEGFERTLRRVAYTAISPPVTGLSVQSFGSEGAGLVALVVPDSADAPHLVFRDQAFSAPIRNHSDTEWMREREIESAYRARFSAFADATVIANELYDEAARAYASIGAAAIVGIAQPRHAQKPIDRERGELVDLSADAWGMTRRWTGDSTFQLISHLDRWNPQTGFRRWILRGDGKDEKMQSHVAVHHDGAVSMAWRIGAQRSGLETFNAANEVTSLGIEVFVANLLAMVRAVADTGASGDMLVQLGIEWNGAGTLFCHEVDSRGHQIARSGIFGSRYTRVRAVIDTRVSDDDFYAQVRSLAEDCVAQFGIRGLSHLKRPPLKLGSEY